MLKIKLKYLRDRFLEYLTDLTEVNLPKPPLFCIEF